MSLFLLAPLSSDIVGDPLFSVYHALSGCFFGGLGNGLLDRRRALEGLADGARRHLASLVGVDAEEALTKSTDKFSRRFRMVEDLAAERGIDMKTAPMSLIDSLWEEVK